MLVCCYARSLPFAGSFLPKSASKCLQFSTLHINATDKILLVLLL